LAQYLAPVSSSARDNIKLTNQATYNQPDNYYKLTHKYNTNKNTVIISKEVVKDICKGRSHYLISIPNGLVKVK